MQVRTPITAKAPTVGLQGIRVAVQVCMISRYYYTLKNTNGPLKGRTVPPGEPGAGDPMSCDEYPFNSAKEGGAGAHVACVNDYANKGGGDLLTSLLAGKHEGFKYQVAVVGIDCTTVTEADTHDCNPIV
jgi:hypothetical protein